VNAALYSKETGYLPGGRYFRHGLFDWETKALTTPPFPKSGRILLGAAGGGRELEGIAQLRFEVTAFELSPQLLKGAREIASNYRGCKAIQGSYADFTSGAIGSAETYDGIVLGWGSFSHLLSKNDRLDLLNTCRQRAPQAPVLLSYLAAPDLPEGKAEKLRRWLQRFHRFLGLNPAHTTLDVFSPTGGFTHLFQPNEIEELTDQAGYSIALAKLVPYPHVVLTPKKA
jgi:2-polyprenyl-3-methyl-5-hydroxy-6-metoxy-1,4-benzoquinol methylase